MAAGRELNLPEGSLSEIIRYKGTDSIVAWTFIVYMFSDIIRTTLNFLIPNFGGRAMLVSWTINGLILCFSIVAFMSVSFKDKTKVWPIYVFVFATILVTALSHPEYAGWFRHKEYGLNLKIFPFSSGIWMLFFVGLFTDKRKLLNSIMFCAKPLFLYYLLLFYRFLKRGYWITIDYLGNEIQNTYNLDWGYNVAFCCIVFLYIYWNSKKLLYLAASLFGMFVIIVGGSRGAFIEIAVAIALIFVQDWRKTKDITKRIGVLFVIFVASLVLICIGFEKIQTIIIRLVENVNISGRIIEMLLSGKLVSNSGRNRIWKMAIDIIEDNKIFGAGFYGDRYVIGPSFYWGYCHNIFLEIWIDYGIFLGSVFILILVKSILRMYLKNKDEEWAMLLIILFSTSVKLYLSDSFWYYKYFWGLLGCIMLWSKQNPGKVRLKFGIRRRN